MTGLNKQDWMTLFLTAIAAMVGGGGAAVYKIENTDFRPNAYTSITAAEHRAEDKEWVRQYVEDKVDRLRKEFDQEHSALNTLIQGCIGNATRHDKNAERWIQRIIETEKDVQECFRELRLIRAKP